MAKYVTKEELEQVKDTINSIKNRMRIYDVKLDLPDENGGYYKNYLIFPPKEYKEQAKAFSIVENFGSLSCRMMDISGEKREVWGINQIQYEKLLEAGINFEAYS